MAVVYTGGTFDVFHAGHVDFLETCKRIAGNSYSENSSQLNQVIVGLNTDEFVERFKGKKPICSYEERESVLRSCKWVDWIIKNIGEESFPKTHKELKWPLNCHIDFIVIGDDWAKKDYYAQMGFTPAWLEKRNIKLLYVARHRDLSSTQIKERVNG